MPSNRLILSIFSGTLAGLIGGILGITGVIVVIPCVLLFGLFSNHNQALGTILFGIDPIQSLFSVIKYAQQNKVEYIIGISLFISYFIAAYFGAKLNQRFNDKTLKYGTAALLFMLAFYMLYNTHLYKLSLTL